MNHYIIVRLECPECEEQHMEKLKIERLPIETHSKCFGFDAYECSTCGEMVKPYLVEVSL